MQKEMTNHNGNQITDDGQHKKKTHFFQQLTVILHLKGSKNQNRIHNQCAQSGQTLFCIIINDSHLTTDHAYNHNNKDRNNLSKYRCNYHSLCSAFLFNCPFFNSYNTTYRYTGQQAYQHFNYEITISHMEQQKTISLEDL